MYMLVTVIIFYFLSLKRFCKDLIEITVNRSFCEMNVSHLILLSHNLDDVESTI